MPSATAMEREVSATERKLELAQRSLKNVLSQVEREQTRLRETKESIRSVIDDGNEQVRKAKQDAADENIRMLTEARLKHSHAEAIVLAAEDAAKAIPIRVEAEAEVAIKKQLADAVELVESVKSMVVLVAELEKRKHELVDEIRRIEAEHGDLKTRHDKLRYNMEAMRKQLAGTQ